MNIDQIDREDVAVQVTATPFNGHSWDGTPFTAMPDWLARAFERGDVVAHTRGGTDYAQWDVKTERGVVSAGPGDWIIRRKLGDLSVVAEQDAKIPASAGVVAG